MLLSDHAPRVCARILAWCDRRPLRAEALARGLLAITPPESPDYPWVLLILGWSLLAPQRLDVALPLLQEAHEQFARMSDRAGTLRARHGLMVVTFLQGAPAEQQAEWESLIAALDAHGFAREAAQARVTQLRHLNFLGRSADALALAAPVQAAVARDGGTVEQALLLRTLGVAHLQVGSFAEAVAALTTAAEGFTRARHPSELAKTWFELARVAFAQEDYPAALERQQQARAIFARLPLPIWVAFCDKNIGAIAAKLGRPHQAIATLVPTRAAFLDLGMLAHAADCDLNLGNVAYHNGLFELALAAWRRSEACYISLTSRRMALVSRRNQAEALARLGRHEEAEVVLTALLPLVEELGAHDDQGEIFQLLGELLHIRGEADHARAYLLHAEGLFAARANGPATARAYLALAWLALAQGQLSEAGDRFQQAASGLAELPMYSWRAMHGLGRCAELSGAPGEALIHYQEATATVARLRQALAEEHASSAMFREARQLIADTIRLAAVQGEPLLVLQLAEQQRALALQQQLRREAFTFPPALQAEYELRRQELRALVAQGETADSALDAAVTAYLEILLHGRHATTAPAAPIEQPLDLEALRATLGAYYSEAWTALVYVQADDQLFAITITPGQTHLRTLPLGQQLRRRLERACLPRYRSYTYQDFPFQSGQRTTPWADLAALGEELIPQEAYTRLEPSHRLLIVPGGPLHSLPWAALRVGERWLTEQCIIQITPSLQIWPELVRRARPSGDALLLGVSQFGERAAPLPNAIPSLDLAQRLWPHPARRLEDSAVTRAAIRAAAATGELGNVGLIHLATHGQLTAGRGMLAHLKLADDDLLADEVTQLRLGGALVVLVACEGAQGETLPGEELVSLSWSFLAAGARDVVASLWQLYDLLILPLLEPLYAALAAGHDAPTAVAEMQRAYIGAGYTDPEGVTAMPFVWASLCATGAGGGSSVSAGGTTPAD